LKDLGQDPRTELKIQPSRKGENRRPKITSHRLWSVLIFFLAYFRPSPTSALSYEKAMNFEVVDKKNAVVTGFVDFRLGKSPK
jgi:hypothetical protein